MRLATVYLGIDVACAAGKRLPICVVSAEDPLTPLMISKSLVRLIPRGVGNKEVFSPEPFRAVAAQIASVIKHLVSEIGWRVERIALDAPSGPPIVQRQSEDELRRCGLSCFRTPPKSAWTDIRIECANHIQRGGSVSTLPYANKIWMLFGFELFSSLRREFPIEVIETYPFAVVRELLPACAHRLAAAWQATAGRAR
jgi:hypothetical protein